MKEKSIRKYLLSADCLNTVEAECIDCIYTESIAEAAKKNDEYFNKRMQEYEESDDFFRYVTNYINSDDNDKGENLRRLERILKQLHISFISEIKDVATLDSYTESFINFITDHSKIWQGFLQMHQEMEKSENG